MTVSDPGENIRNQYRRPEFISMGRGKDWRRGTKTYGGLVGDFPLDLPEISGYCIVIVE